MTDAEQPDAEKSEDGRTVVVLTMNQNDLALHIVAACTNRTVKPGTDPMPLLEELKKQDEDLYEFTMRAAYAALRYFDERMAELNEQTQKADGRDLVVGGMTRNSELH
jgi:hypothetical protein